MSRRLSSIRFAHHAAGLPSPIEDATVSAVWEGIRRTHGAPPEQALPLMPPLLWDCLTATPTINTDGTPSMAGLRDRVVLLVGFVGALRRSELCAIDVEHLEAHDKGLVLHIPRSKTNQTGENDQLVILPSSPTSGRCPVAAIASWRRTAGIDIGPLVRGLKRNSQPRATRLNDQAVTNIVQGAIRRAGTDPTGYSAHSLRAGFVTWCNLIGQPDRTIARQTRHRSLQSLEPYVRIHDAWTNNAATALTQREYRVLRAHGIACVRTRLEAPARAAAWRGQRPGNGWASRSETSTSSCSTRSSSGDPAVAHLPSRDRWILPAGRSASTIVRSGRRTASAPDHTGTVRHGGEEPVPPARRRP